MALSDEDLKKIRGVVAEEVNSGISGLRSSLNTLNDKMTSLEEKMNRMEARILFSLDIWQRDGTDTLENHEARIKRLEKLAAH
jgi:hypothetical protein